MIKKLGLLILLLNSFLFANSIEEAIYKIPLKDRINIRYFFRDFVYGNHLGFIFFDLKPVALLTHTISVPANCIYDRYGNSMSMKGWEAWKKFEYLFPHPNFLFVEEIKVESGLKHRDIFAINKKNLLITIEKHYPDFKSKLGNDFSPFQFLKNVEKNGSLRAELNNDEELLGIVLGYGKESSRKFAENNDCLTCLCPSNDKSKITGIIFMGDPTSQETKLLMSQYHKTQIAIYQMYKGKDPLLVTLSNLVSE